MSISFIILLQAAIAHSGGTDAYGCHAGRLPYHCHGGGGGSSYGEAMILKQQVEKMKRENALLEIEVHFFREWNDKKIILASIDREIIGLNEILLSDTLTEETRPAYESTLFSKQMEWNTYMSKYIAYAFVACDKYDFCAPANEISIGLQNDASQYYYPEK